MVVGCQTIEGPTVERVHCEALQARLGVKSVLGVGLATTVIRLDRREKRINQY